MHLDLCNRTLLQSTPLWDLISIFIGSVIVVWMYSICSFEFVSTLFNVHLTLEIVVVTCMCAIKYPWSEKKETRKMKTN